MSQDVLPVKGKDVAKDVSQLISKDPDSLSDSVVGLGRNSYVRYAVSLVRSTEFP